MLQIKVLGSTEIRGPDGPLALRGVKQRILVTQLALARGRPVSLSALVEALWGEQPPRNPEHALQAHVSRVRRELRTEIERTTSGYRLVSDEIDLDVARFDALVASARELTEVDDLTVVEMLDEALRLWRGTVFADLDEVDSLAPVAARLNEDWHHAQAERIDALLRIEQGDGLVALLRELVAEHPFRERYWAQLMQALHLQGRTGEALQTYERARGLLASQLGTAPGALLTDMHVQVLAEPQATSRAPDSADASRDGLGESSGLSLAGRVRELHVMNELWSEVSRGLRVVTISGDPGIGKTRLAREFAGRLAAGGVRVLRGHCDVAAASPYQPLMEALRADVAGLEGEALSRRLGAGAEDLVRILPELRERLVDAQAPWPDRRAVRATDASAELRRTVVAVTEWLIAATIDAAMVLVIDDLHWADRQTLLLLRDLMRDPGDAQVLLVLTVRDREHLRDSVNHDLIAQFTRQSDRVRHLPLSGLRRDEVFELLRKEWGDQVSCEDGLASRIVEASGGNPLFALELAREPSGLKTPTAGVRELIRARLDGFDASLRELLSRAAVMGSEFDPFVVQHSCGLGASEFDASLDAAVFARIVEPVEGLRANFAFAHELVRGAVYEATTPLRRAQIHLEIATAIERLYAADLPRHHSDLAHHFAAGASAGSAHKAVEYLILAGNEAISQRALSVGVGHYRWALELLPDDADWEQRCDLLTMLGSAESLAGDSAYRATLLLAARLATDHGDVRRLTEVVVTNSRGWWSSTAGIDHERVAFIEAALANVSAGDHGTRAHLLSAWTLENTRDPHLRGQVLSRSREAVSLAQGLGDDHALATVLGHRFAVSFALFEDPFGCVEIAEQILELARGRADPNLRLSGLIGLAQASMMVADFATVDRVLTQTLELAESLDLRPRLWLAKGWQTMCAGTRGDLARAEEMATDVWEMGVRWAQPDATTWFAGQLFSIRWRQGRLSEMIDAIESEVATQADGIPAWRAAHALALVSVGRHDEAGRILDELVDRNFSQLPVDMLWLHATVFLAEVTAALDRRDAAQILHRMLEPYTGLMAHNGTIDAGPVDIALAQTAHVLGSEAADKYLRAAEELCQRIDAPLWLARVRELADR